MLAALILAASALQAFVPGSVPEVGDYWTVLGGGLLTIGHLAVLMAATGHVFAIRSGYRIAGRRTTFAARFATLEGLLGVGAAALAAGVAALAAVAWQWVARDFGAARSIFLPVLGTSLVIVGLQTVMSGFLMAMVSGNEAEFLPLPEGAHRRRAPQHDDR
jgi:hypothetical protein